MALNAAEQNKLKRLMAENLDDGGQPLPGTDTKDLQEIERLMAKQTAAPKAREKEPRRHKLSDEGQCLVEDGADYLGWKYTSVGVVEFFQKPAPQPPSVSEGAFPVPTFPTAVQVMPDGQVRDSGHKFSEELVASLKKD